MERSIRPGAGEISGADLGKNVAAAMNVF